MYADISYGAQLIPVFHLVPVQAAGDGWAAEGMVCGPWAACAEGDSSFARKCAGMIGGLVVSGGAAAAAGAERATNEDATARGRRSRHGRRRAAKNQAFVPTAEAMTFEHSAPLAGDWAAPHVLDGSMTYPALGCHSSADCWALSRPSTTASTAASTTDGFLTPEPQAEASSPRTSSSLEALGVDGLSAVAGDACWNEGEDLRAMALSKDTCREVQRRLEEASGSVRDAIFAALVPHTVELYESPHGNHCLTKAIEVMPTQSLGPLIHQIEAKGVLTVAKHRFGCRLMERLTEHCTKKDIAPLVNVFIQCAEELSRHDCGNFVIQSLLEHGDEESRAAVLQRLLPNLPMLSMHRKASHVVQCALRFCSPEGQRAIVESVLRAQSPHSLEEIADSRYGSYVAEELLPALRYLEHPELLQEALGRMAAALPERQSSVYFVRVAAQFGLVEKVPVGDSDAEE